MWLIGVNEQSVKEGLRRWPEEAERGDPLSQYFLGIVLLEGKYVPIDMEAARNWLHKSAEQGIADAQFHLGNMLLLGQGGPVNLIGARELFLLAQNDFPEAKRNYSFMCLNGLGGSRNIDEAFKYAILANRQGVDCRELLTTIVANGEVSYFEPEAADLGNWNEAKKAYRAALARPAETSITTPNA